MVGNQKGGVHTQKLKTFGIIAVLLLGAMFVVVSADDSAAVNSVSEDQFAKGGNVVTFDLEGDSNYYYTAGLFDGSEEKQGAISSSDAKGSLGSDSKKTIRVTTPTQAGKYTLKVEYFSDEAYENSVAKFERTVKSVDPIVLKATVKNSGDVDMPLNVYFVINDEKIDSSVQTVTVTKGGSKDVTYEYIVDDVKQFTYSLESEGFIDGSVITGLGEKQTVYPSENDYTFITVILVVVLAALLIAMVLVLRKPVVNTGKPRARR